MDFRRRDFPSIRTICHPTNIYRAPTMCQTLFWVSLIQLVNKMKILGKT